MLKFFFLLLLAANGLLYAYHQGHLEKLFPSGREPGRIAKQINADKFKLVPAPAMNVPSDAATPEPAVAEAAHTQDLAACTEIGNFTAAEARRFEARLADSPLSAKLSRRAVQETSTHMILIPPQEGKEGADKKAGELRKLGVTDFYVIQDNNDQRWGISLGIFKTEEAARTRLVALNQQGVRSARLIDYNMQLSRVAFQLRELDDDTKSTFARLKSEFPRQEMRTCE